MSSLKEQPYHQYVFDSEKRKFIGNFEEMYQQEDVQGYDSWYQDDTTHIVKRLVLALLQEYNFNLILDIGCGKGSFTHLLKKKNNKVSGCDISETAIKKASAKYPEIHFFVASSDKLMQEYKLKHDFVMIMEVLSYIKSWKSFIEYVSGITDYLLLTLYLPSDPIGYVKTFDKLKDEVRKYFLTIHEMVIDQSVIILLLKRDDK